jgi:hypothetical protein
MLYYLFVCLLLIAEHIRFCLVLHLLTCQLSCRRQETRDKTVYRRIQFDLCANLFEQSLQLEHLLMITWVKHCFFFVSFESIDLTIYNTSVYIHNAWIIHSIDEETWLSLFSFLFSMCFFFLSVFWSTNIDILLCVSSFQLHMMKKKTCTMNNKW